MTLADANPLKETRDSPMEINPQAVQLQARQGITRPQPASKKGMPAHLFMPPALSTLTMAGDVFFAGVAVVIAADWARGGGGADGGLYGLWAFPFLTVGFLWARGLYRRQLAVSFLEVLPRVLGATALAAVYLLMVLLALYEPAGAGAISARVWALSVVTISVWHLVRLWLHRRVLRAGGGIPTLIVGAGRIGHQVARRLVDRPEYGLKPVGFLDPDPPAAAAPATGMPVLGAPEELTDVAHATGAEHVVIAFSSMSDRQMLHVVRECQGAGLRISVVPRLFDVTGQRVALEHLGGLPVFTLQQIDTRGALFALKYLIERFAAAVGLVCLAPLFVVLALGVRLSSPGPVLYSQIRVGRDGQPFNLLKFRTMAGRSTDDARFELPEGSAPGGVEGIDRRTALGRWLRRTSLDELPQLLNVVRGEMGLIGPRPERPEYVEVFQRNIERYGERHRVKAGMTGWAQVNGLRGQTSIADRAEWDNFYIENWSLGLDLRILVLTVRALFRRFED